MAVYYVSNSGSDAAAGTAPSTAWLTVSKVQAFALQPGDTVLFRRSDVWREQLALTTRSGSAGSPIVFGAYGLGEPPTIKGSDVIPASGWTLHSGNTYKKTLALGSPTYAGGSPVIDSGAVLLQDGLPLSQKASAAAVDGVAGSYAWVAGVLYVRATDNSNPGTNGKTYEYPTRDYCFAAQGPCSYLTVRDLRFEQVMQFGFLSLDYANHHITVRNCVARWSCGSGIRTYGHGFLVTGCAAYENRRYGGFTSFFQPGYQSIVEYCTAHDNGTDVTYDTDSYYRDHGFYFAGTNAETRYCVSYNNTGHGFKAGQASKADLVFRRNVGYLNGHAGGFVDLDDITYNTAPKTYWYHNTFDRNGVGFRADSSTTIAFIDNICTNSLNVGAGIKGTGILCSSGGSIQNCDYNLVYGNATAAYNGLAAGAHDVAADPQFRDAPDYNYALASTSPARSAGSVLDVDVMDGRPDIGALEYGLLSTARQGDLLDVPSPPSGTLPLTTV